MILKYTGIEINIEGPNKGVTLDIYHRFILEGISNV